MPVIHIKGALGTWNTTFVALENDVLWNKGDKFRVVQRSWDENGTLHIDVVPIVEEESGDAQVPGEGDDG